MYIYCFADPNAASADDEEASTSAAALVPAAQPRPSTSGFSLNRKNVRQKPANLGLSKRARSETRAQNVSKAMILFHAKRKQAKLLQQQQQQQNDEENQDVEEDEQPDL